MLAAGPHSERGAAFQPPSPSLSAWIPCRPRRRVKCRLLANQQDNVLLVGIACGPPVAGMALPTFCIEWATRAIRLSCPTLFLP
jgi:hypothetical protein